MSSANSEAELLPETLVNGITKTIKTSKDLLKKGAKAVEEGLPEISIRPPRTLKDWLPNSFTVVPVHYQNAKLSSKKFNEQTDHNTAIKDNEKVSLLKGLTIGRVYKPLKFWVWQFTLTPSFSYAEFKTIHESNSSSSVTQKMRMFQLSYGGGLLWHLPKYYGSFYIKIGIGPILFRGKFNDSIEKSKIRFAPLGQASYYNFLTDHLFVMLKYKKTFILKNNVFQKRTASGLSYLKQIDILSLNLGIAF